MAEHEAVEDGAVWVQKHRWPIYFFVAVAFWNLVGAEERDRSQREELT